SSLGVGIRKGAVKVGGGGHPLLRFFYKNRRYRPAHLATFSTRNTAPVALGKNHPYDFMSGNLTAGQSEMLKADFFTVNMWIRRVRLAIFVALLAAGMGTSPPLAQPLKTRFLPLQLPNLFRWVL